MITFIIVLGVWCVLGFFAVRMNIIYLDSCNKKESGPTVGWWTPLLFITGPIAWVGMICGPPDGQYKSRAHFFPSIAMRVPRLNEKIVRRVFGVSNDDLSH